MIFFKNLMYCRKCVILNIIYFLLANDETNQFISFIKYFIKQLKISKHTVRFKFLQLQSLLLSWVSLYPQNRIIPTDLTCIKLTNVQWTHLNLGRQHEEGIALHIHDTCVLRINICQILSNSVLTDEVPFSKMVTSYISL